MKTKILLASAFALLAQGCATAPGLYSYRQSHGYSRSYDQVWEDTIGFFANNNIQVKNIAKDSGVIYAEQTSFGDDLADCGKRGIATSIGRMATLNVFIMRSSSPSIRVNTKFQETRKFDNSVWTVECNSKGIIEEVILRHVADMQANPAMQAAPPAIQAAPIVPVAESAAEKEFEPRRQRQTTAAEPLQGSRFNDGGKGRSKFWEGK